MRSHRRTPTGIRVRHSRSCATSHDQGQCNCSPGYEASVYSARDGRKLRKTFPTLSAARAWRHDAASVRPARARCGPPSRQRCRKRPKPGWTGARDGLIRNRSGDEFKPSTLPSYEQSLNTRVLTLRAVKLSTFGRTDIQDFADRLLAQGLDPSTIRNTLMPLRAIYRRALSRGEVAVNPTTGSRSRRAGTARAYRLSGGGGRVDRGPTRRGAGALGDRLLRGPSARRIDGSRLGEH